jgi:Rps23 Pro-64 3,4-dihydroxylase Tpa1-like proline 4-hydroxylase
MNPTLRLRREDGFFEFDRKNCSEVGKSLHDQFINNDPFPHIILDDFIDADILRTINQEFPKPDGGRFSDAFSQLKTGYRLGTIRSAYIHDLLSALNSSAFLHFLEVLTGIRGLVADPHYIGGGLHETRRGGHLSIHADFNVLPQTRLLRRLNLIIFINEHWDPQWGGALELWDRSMSACRQAAQPVLGRAVIFRTDQHSYHGHPDPLETPPEVTRRSIAIYYYTVPTRKVIPQTTVFRARPNTADQATPLRQRFFHAGRMLFGKNDEG